jgi:hypothetical protein
MGHGHKERRRLKRYGYGAESSEQFGDDDALDILLKYGFGVGYDPARIDFNAKVAAYVEVYVLIALQFDDKLERAAEVLDCELSLADEASALRGPSRQRAAFRLAHAQAISDKLRRGNGSHEGREAEDEHKRKGERDGLFSHLGSPVSNRLVYCRLPNG